MGTGFTTKLTQTGIVLWVTFNSATFSGFEAPPDLAKVADPDQGVSAYIFKGGGTVSGYCPFFCGRPPSFAWWGFTQPHSRLLALSVFPPCVGDGSPLAGGASRRLAPMANICRCIFRTGTLHVHGYSRGSTAGRCLEKSPLFWKRGSHESHFYRHLAYN